MTNRIEGLIAAPFTPMTTDGEISLEIIPEYAKKLKKDGLKGVFICGTTGEGMLMTNEERKLVAGKWIESQEEDFKIIVHVGTTSAAQSRDLAAHAREKGAYATGCMGPVFLRPAGLQDLVDFCAEVAAGAPDLPFYYYHIPSVSGVQFSMIAFMTLAAKQIPNFAGIKFTDNNFMEMQQCLNFEDNKYEILHGYDELLLAGLAFGAEGAVGSTYNFMAPLYTEIIEDFKNRRMDAARQKQMKSVEIIAVLNNYGGAIISGKRLMKAMGIDCGNFRVPMAKFNEERYDDFIRDLKAVGFPLN